MDEVLEYLRRELRHRLELPDDEVVLDNASVLSDDSDTHGVAITLVNLKVSAYQGSGLGRPDLLDALELLVLVSFRFWRYQDSLRHLYRTVRLFHAKPAYTAAESHPDNPFPENIDKLVFTLCPVEFDTLHDIWANLGGVMLPSALYTLRIVRSQRV